MDVHVMIPPGASPVTFDPSPRELVRISEARAYFKIGHIEFEKGWDKKMKAINDSLRFFDLSENVDLISSEEHHHHEHGHKHAHGIDPHIWMSVKNTKIIAENIVNALIELDPGQSDEFMKNFNEFKSELDTLDGWIAGQLENRERDVFLIFHPALTYYARDYDLEQESLEFEGKQPTPGHFKEIAEIANGQNIHHVFIQKQFDIENTQMLAKQIEAQIVEINPLDENWGEQMISITKKIKTALN
jgi:zinc transport system substrate-binding protein